MNVNEVVKFVDQIVFDKTGKHLDDIQTAVVEGTWQRQTYDDIAQECNVTKNHVGDVGAELWQLLSQILQEDIKKTNFRSTFERLQISSLPIVIQNNNNNNILNFGSSYLYQSNDHNQENNKFKSIHYDISLAPQITNFYNRDCELHKIDDWISNQSTSLISVLGLYGIGKTTLVKKFVDLHLEQFEVIIWRSLKHPKPLNLLIDDLLNVCQQEAQVSISDKLTQFFKILSEKKCLIILDDIHHIFTKGQFAGTYQIEYQDYQNFFTMVAKIEHQSSVILISQEQCAEMEFLDEELYPIKFLELSGLYDKEILRNTGLTDEDSWINLIDLYEGNLGYLKSIAGSIRKIFDGKVADFLAENELVITKDIQFLLSQVFNNISPTEKQIILELSKFNQAVSREDLKATLDLSSSDFINGLESLQQRYLIQKIKTEKIMFKLSPVFRQYIRNISQRL
ncbi:NB-ARC domain-containing protein [Aulosira sp. FACHB-615]|uniref:NB-ARC domain-containing protein n=1 Tax=Aulosira sp. FACHB-615 TaxID=2692777 RepID=UPI001683C131|nr:NB-ARC domain-containing protein [Aulosira sp. FACHB-615]MBD2490647.1 AAA family ATPase [Aulosira sp. FACHB-615]